MTDLVEDWNLAKRAAAGDLQAFNALVIRYQKPVLRYCFHMLGSIQEAEDVGQETFLNLYRALGRIQPQSAFSTFVFCCARNTALNHLRSSKRQKRTYAAFQWEQQRITTDIPDTNASRAEMTELLRQGIAELPHEFREVFVLREFEGMAYTEIADVLNCPVGTVRSRLARARELLRQFFLRVYGDTL